jgi:hypothetical protein
MTESQTLWYIFNLNGHLGTDEIWTLHTTTPSSSRAVVPLHIRYFAVIAPIDRGEWKREEFKSVSWLEL